MREEGRESLREMGLITFFSWKKKKKAGAYQRGGLIWERELCRLFKVFQKVWTIRAGTIFFNFCLKLGMPSLQSYGLYCYYDEINFTCIAKFGAALSYSSKTLFPGFLLHQVFEGKLSPGNEVVKGFQRHNWNKIPFETPKCRQE